MTISDTSQNGVRILMVSAWWRVPSTWSAVAWRDQTRCVWYTKNTIDAQEDKNVTKLSAVPCAACVYCHATPCGGPPARRPALTSSPARCCVKVVASYSTPAAKMVATASLAAFMEASWCEPSLHLASVMLACRFASATWLARNIARAAKSR